MQLTRSQALKSLVALTATAAVPSLIKAAIPESPHKIDIVSIVDRLVRHMEDITGARYNNKDNHLCIYCPPEMNIPEVYKRLDNAYPKSYIAFWREWFHAKSQCNSILIHMSSYLEIHGSRHIAYNGWAAYDIKNGSWSDSAGNIF